MNILLRPVTRDNFEECCNLEITEAQQEFVAPNVYSLAESKFVPEFVPLAIYDGDLMVGFLMYGRDDLDGVPVWMLLRFMIDYRSQRKGYGRAALELFIEYVREKTDCKALYITIMPGNDVALNLYSSLGFEERGDPEDGEMVLRFRSRQRSRV
ncbi:MAG: GNAT family N-acetyltransferase [Chloroflexota bacterium]